MLTLYGAIMCIGGLLFGWATLHAQVLPRRSAICLIAGVLHVAATAGLPARSRTVAAAGLDAAFVGVSASLLRRRQVRP